MLQQVCRTRASGSRFEVLSVVKATYEKLLINRYSKEQFFLLLTDSLEIKYNHDHQDIDFFS